MKHYCVQRTAESRTLACGKIVKTKLISIIFTAALLSLAESGFAQGFVNLDFEAANLSAYGAGPAAVPATNAIPGWTAYLGGVPQTDILLRFKTS
jgi:hypothetical protein